MGEDKDLDINVDENLSFSGPRHAQKYWKPATRVTDEAKCDFLEELILSGGNVTRAVEEVEVTLPSLLHARRVDPLFAEAWEEAVLEGAILLEDEARRRAQDGVDEDVYYKGEVVGTVKRYSDGLLQFLLRGNNPQKFKERVSNEHSGPDGDPIVIEDARAALARRLGAVDTGTTVGSCSDDEPTGGKSG